MSIKFSVAKRQNITPVILSISVFASLLLGLIVMGIIFAFNGVNPFAAIGAIFAGSFGSFYGFKETVTKAIPLIIIGVGLIIAFKGKFWNIGAEGQLLIGATLATWVALNIGPRATPIIVIPLMFIAGFIGGAITASIPAILKVKFRIDEVISTLMFNYIAAEFVNYLIVGPWKGKTQFGFPYTDRFPESAQLGLIPGSRIHYVTLIIAIIAVVVMFIIIYRTKFGYEVRIIGENKDAGRYAGINFFRTMLFMMIISGGLAGIAGVGEVAGLHHKLSYPFTISAGYGYIGIIVAWLARLNPILAIFSALFFAGIKVGGDAIQTKFGLPAATVDVFNGVVLFFLISSDYFINNKVTISLNNKTKNVKKEQI